MPDEKRASSTVIEAVKILDLWDRQPLLEATVAEVAAAVGMSAGKARPLIAAWEAAGFLRRNGEGKLVLGDALIKVSEKYRLALMKRWGGELQTLNRIAGDAAAEIEAGLFDPEADLEAAIHEQSAEETPADAEPERPFQPPTGMN